MAGDFLVDPDALDKDAQKWTQWSSELAAIAATIPLLGEGLDPLAFSDLPNAYQVAAAYGTATRAIQTAMNTGVEQFTGFATTLTFAATTYRNAEDENLAEIAKSVASLESI
jgi:hypothetical protein